MTAAENTSWIYYLRANDAALRSFQLFIESFEQDATAKMREAVAEGKLRDAQNYENLLENWQTIARYVKIEDEEANAQVIYNEEQKGED